MPLVGVWRCVFQLILGLSSTEWWWYCPCGPSYRAALTMSSEDAPVLFQELSKAFHLPSSPSSAINRMLPSALRQREVTSGWTWAASDSGALLCCGTWSQVGLPRGHFAGRMSNGERSFTTGEQRETASSEAFKCKVLSREFEKARFQGDQSRKMRAPQESKAPCSQEQTAEILPPPLKEEPSRTMESGCPSPRPEVAWPSLQTSAPGMHLSGRTDLEASKCTCSFDFPSFTGWGWFHGFLQRPLPSLLLVVG